MKKYLLFTFVFLCLTNVIAQTAKYRVLSLPTLKNGVALREPWVGGLNSPQFSPVNLNFDNYMDLFIFDRVGNTVLTYINNGTNSDTAYTYAPKYEQLFPKDLSDWALIRDYNLDGISDIFAWTSTGVKVYKGSIANGLLKFDLVSNLLLYSDGTYNINCYVSRVDIPVFTDVNRDGDMDILTFGVSGSSVGYYENQTIEHPGDIRYAYDSLKYFFEDCWGNFLEDQNNNSVYLNISCKTGGLPLDVTDGARHAGSTIYNFDHGNDHDVDLLLGDISFNNLVYVQNCGDSLYANACSYEANFPVCNTPVDLPFFPSAFGIDANNDGLEDLLISPNVSTYSASDLKNVMFYKNTMDTACQFQYQSDSFLIHHQLDYGSDSKPYFYDFDGDGLQDILVGNYGYFRPSINSLSAIAYLRNTGTVTQPAYTLVTTDLASISSFNLIGMHPTFGDLDGDGKKDMLIGEKTGFIHFFKNTAPTGSFFSNMTIPNYFGIDVGTNSAPLIYDVNGDLLNDLVIGTERGDVRYYWNFGTPTAPLFHADSVNKNFGNRTYNYIAENSTPFIASEAGILKLYTGSLAGAIFKYEINLDSLKKGTFQLVDSNYLHQVVGKKSTISIQDINNDGLLEYLVGNSRGGLQLYSDSIWNPETVLSINKVNNIGEIIIYPNPANGVVVCENKQGNFTQPTAEIYNLLGSKMNTTNTFSNTLINIETSHLSNGIYFIRVADKGISFTGKILIQH